jgi:RimJ/RimL family protein N-acetyltransferase/DNA-binding transcriptional ArsR family regulator
MPDTNTANSLLPKRGRPKAPLLGDLDLVCAAIAHPARRQVLEELQRDGESTALTLARRHASVKAALAHLRVLVEAGLVEYRRGGGGDGRQHHYRVVPERLALAQEWLAEFRAEDGRRVAAPTDAVEREGGGALPYKPVPTPILDGTLVRMVPFTAQAIPFVQAALAHREQLWRYTIAPMDTAEDARAYAQHALAEQAAGRLAVYGIFAKPGVGDVEKLTFAGSSRLVRTDPQHHGYEIGWSWLLPQFQRTGINAEAKLRLLTMAFETCGARRVYFKGDARNAQSRAALEKLGAQFEGVLRSQLTLPDGTMRDSFYFSLLPAEWPAVKARLEERVAAAASAIIP